MTITIDFGFQKQNTKLNFRYCIYFFDLDCARRGTSAVKADHLCQSCKKEFFLTLCKKTHAEIVLVPVKLELSEWQWKQATSVTALCSSLDGMGIGIFSWGDFALLGSLQLVLLSKIHVWVISCGCYGACACLSHKC